MRKVLAGLNFDPSLLPASAGMIGTLSKGAQLPARSCCSLKQRRQLWYTPSQGPASLEPVFRIKICMSSLNVVVFCLWGRRMNPCFKNTCSLIDGDQKTASERLYFSTLGHCFVMRVVQITSDRPRKSSPKASPKAKRRSLAESKRMLGSDLRDKSKTPECKFVQTPIATHAPRTPMHPKPYAHQTYKCNCVFTHMGVLSFRACGNRVFPICTAEHTILVHFPICLHMCVLLANTVEPILCEHFCGAYHVYIYIYIYTYMCMCREREKCTHLCVHS